MRDLLDHPPFQKVKKDPTKLVAGKLNKYLWKLHQEGTIDRDLYNTLRSSSCALPRFYGRVKIHKPSKPVRPVISAVGTALYPVSKYLARVLKPLAGETEYTIRNSSDFIRQIERVTVSEEEELVSFDVTALYTSLPIERTLMAVRSMFEDENSQCVATPLSTDQIMQLLELCLKSTFFSFRGGFYQLTDGVAMGSPVSSVVANIFMIDFERKALASAISFEPRLWK